MPACFARVGGSHWERHGGMASARDLANRRAITAALMLATLMNTLDSTIANVALPKIQGSVSAAQDQITWVLTSYIIAAAIMTPTTGWLAGRFGRKQVFIVSIVGFTVASALCGAASDAILDDELVRGFILQVMVEAQAVGEKIGCAITESGEDRIAVTRKLGAFKTSMLQDVEAGRALELDALVAAPREIARRVGVATPSMDALLGLSRLFARTRGLYPL